MDDKKPLLPESADERKRIPLARGLFDYFPAALIEVAKVSYQGNLQHNGPTSPIQWSRIFGIRRRTSKS